MDDRVVLRSERGPKGSRHLEARRDSEGNITLEGHDLGTGVAAFWGKDHSEYEWVHTIRVGQDQNIREVLGGVVGCDVLRLISRWCEQHDPAELESTLEQRGIKFERWSWVGTDWD
jgi:hypothetical protein